MSEETFTLSLAEIWPAIMDDAWRHKRITDKQYQAFLDQLYEEKKREEKCSTGSRGTK